MIKLSLIAAFDDNMGVGFENQLPWHIPEDLKHFKSITTGQNMIMGKKTFDSLPGILPNRLHIVLTTDQTLKSNNENVIYVNSVEKCEELLNELENKNNIVIGGSVIWELFLDKIDIFYITHVFGKFEVDTYFPKKFKKMNTKLISRTKTESCEYLTYHKIT